MYWVGKGNLLITTGKSITKTIKNGDEITPELVKSEKSEYGLTPVFIERHQQTGDISDNPLAGKVAKNVNIMQNQLIEKSKRIKELEEIISRPVEVKATGKAKEIEESYKLKISEIESTHSEEVERLSSEIETISEYCKKLVNQIEELGETAVEADSEEPKKGKGSKKGKG
jgi:hypothetical protein